jgi:hypothetical protein
MIGCSRQGSPHPNPPPLAGEGADRAALKTFPACVEGLLKPPKFAPSPAGGGGWGWGLVS